MTTKDQSIITLGQCLYRLAGQRIRPTAVLYLYVGKLGWEPAEQMRARLTSIQSLDLSWDAYLVVDDGEGQSPGIYLFGPDGQSYRAFEIETAIEAAQAALSQASKQSDQDQRCQVVHPQYRFLLFDDVCQPTRMTIQLTAKRHAADLEDKRRLRIAEEVEWTLKQQGLSLQVITTPETEAPQVASDVFALNEGGQP